MSRRDGRTYRVERRQLSVLFCDLVGSTELSSRLDPEDMHAVVVTFLRACAAAVEGAGGYVARFMGDGLLAYFGYPDAREDGAERAVHAALAVHEAAVPLVTPDGQPLKVRCGIATGLVVVGEVLGEGAAEEHSVIGETPNLAARLQSLASPGQVIVSDATRRLAGGLFDFASLGMPTLKGIVLDQPVWRVLGPRATADRFSSRRRAGLSPLQGRHRELENLLGAWRRAAEGEAEFVLLEGEPGIGKTRLVHELRRRVARQPHVWLEGGGAQIFANTPFHPVIQMARRALESAAGGASAEVLGRLERVLAAAGVDDPAAAPLIADLVGFAMPQTAAPTGLDRDEQRRRLIATLRAWLVATARRWPTVLVIEDLQWSDPSTRELLAALPDVAVGARLLVVATSRRPERFETWPRFTALPLSRLDLAGTRELASRVADLPPHLARLVASKADGVPLFTEELARLVAQRRELTDGEVPGSLADLLVARLDSLGDDRDVAQLAAVFAGDFRLDLLSALAERTADDIAGALERLASASVVMPVDEAGGVTFAFRHALFRDAAYGCLLKRHRRSLHERAAGLIRDGAPGLAAQRPEVVAYHWDRAEIWHEAAPAWREAARLAEGRRAYREAQQAFEHADAALARLAPSDERAVAELEIASALASVLQINLGYSAPRARDAIARARRLSEALGDPAMAFANAAGAWMVASSAGDYETAGQVSRRLLPIALAGGDPLQVSAAHMMEMTWRYRVGDLLGAEDAFQAGAEPFASPAFLAYPGSIPQTFGNAAVIAWLRGDLDEAHSRLGRVMEICERDDAPYEQAFALYMAAMQAVMMGDFAQGQRLAQRGRDVADTHGFAQFSATARVVEGRAQVGLGAPEVGAALIREGLAVMDRASQSRAGRTMYMSWLGEACDAAGDAAGALVALDEALEVNPGERFFRPETLRLRAELRLGAGDRVGAAADLEAGLSLAKTMGARLLHARCAEVLQAGAPWPASRI